MNVLAICIIAMEMQLVRTPLAALSVAVIMVFREMALLVKVSNQLGSTTTTILTNVPPDVDECTKNTSQCHFYADCVNTIGSHECYCAAGFSGNGTECTGIVLNWVVC